MPTRRKTSLMLLEIFLIFAIILCLFLLLTNNVYGFFQLLYSPFSFAILLIMILEYVILKGLDRSKIYLLELRQMRELRRQHLLFHRELERQLDHISQKVQQLPDHPETQKIKSELARIHQQLKGLT